MVELLWLLVEVEEYAVRDMGFMPRITAGREYIPSENVFSASAARRTGGTDTGNVLNNYE